MSTHSDNQKQQSVILEYFQFEDIDNFVNYLISLPDCKVEPHVSEQKVSKLVAYFEFIEFDFLVKTALTLEKSNVLTIPNAYESTLKQQEKDTAKEMSEELYQNQALSPKQGVFNVQKKPIFIEEITPSIGNSFLKILNSLKTVPVEGEDKLQNTSQKESTKDTQAEKPRSKKLLTKEDYLDIDKKIMSLSDKDLLAIAMANDLDLYSSLGEGRIDAETFRVQARKLARELEIQKLQSKLN